MNIETILAILTGLLIRLFVPLALTALVVFWLHKLDLRWQKEAEAERDLLVKDETPCWKDQGLSTDEIHTRMNASGKPCWQIHRLSNGYLREACLDCEVFLTAPVPSSKPSKAHA
ncbi:MAG: hypothetical protein JNK32_13280 [Anaerolineales bacterium]|nr:hypothetical protein [Anaerolineales bacterium]